MRSKHLRMDSLTTGIALSTPVAVALLTLLATRSPVLAVGGLGVLILIPLALKLPEWVLAAGIVFTLAGGSFASFSTAGGLVLALGAFVAVIGAIAQGRALPWRKALLPIVVLTSLGIRVAIEGDVVTLADIVKAAAAVGLVLASSHKFERLTFALGAAGLVFVFVSAVFGNTNELGTRFTGISGNSNRMVFALLVFLPFLLILTKRGTALPLRLASAAGIVLSISLILASGSSQGLVGLAAIVFILLLRGVLASSGGLRTLLLTATALCVLVAIQPAWRLISGSEDLTTLSGRTPLYSAAWSVIKANPWLGTGLQSVSDAGIVDRSAHSAVLSLAATAGIPLALVWIAIMIILLSRTVALARHGNLLAAAAFVFVVEQLVQSVQILALTWVVVTYFLVLRPDGATVTEDETSRTKEIHAR